MKTIHQLNQAKLKKDLLVIRPGYTVIVHQKIKEGDKERVQKYEGIVISRRGGTGLSATITVRKISAGVGVERIFPLHSPSISKIEVVKKARVRRAKLYYLRGYQKKLKEAAV
jgi:large subunit ribosomal protein L19